MVNWESRADRGRRPPNMGRGQRSASSSKHVPSREKYPTKEAGPAPAPAPRGSPIAKNLARHLSPWTTLTIPQMAIKVRHLYPCLLTLHCPMLASPLFGRVQFIVRPRPGTATSHRRAPVPRAGSLAYRVPCLFAPPSGCILKPGSQPWHIPLVLRTRGPAVMLPQTPHITSSPKRMIFTRLPACTLLPALPNSQEGEDTLGIAQYR